MTIHLAVKTIHPQISCIVGLSHCGSRSAAGRHIVAAAQIVQFTVKVVILKERAAKVLQISFRCKRIGRFFELKG